MEKFIPYEKLSKKEKRKMDLAKRQTWGELNPVTRKPANSKAYNRKRTQDWKKELPDLRLIICYLQSAYSNPSRFFQQSLPSQLLQNPLGLPQTVVQTKGGLADTGDGLVWALVADVIQQCFPQIRESS